MTGNLAVKLHILHQKYGPVVRTAPNELSFIEPSAWKIIYGQQKDRYTPFRKNYDTFNETRNQIGHHSIFLAGDEDHKRMRRILGHAFSSQALRDQDSRIQENVNSLVRGLDGELFSNREVVDLNKWYTWTAFDTVTSVAFSDSFKCLHESKYREWPLQLSKIWKLIVYVSGLKHTVPWLSLVRCIIPISVLQKQVDRLDIVVEKVNKRIDLGSNGKDLMHHILTHNEVDTGLSKAEIVSNTSLLAFAGTETVATLLPALTYLLIQNPRAKQKLVHDLRAHFSDIESMTTERLSQMDYLTACIKEGLRVFPPTPEGLPRVTPPEGAMISGHWVPGNVSTHLPVLLLQSPKKKKKKKKKKNKKTQIGSPHYTHPFK